MGSTPGAKLRYGSEAEAVCRHCLQILTAKAIKIWKFRTIYFLIFDQYVLWWGKRHSGGLAPQPMPACRQCAVYFITYFTCGVFWLARIGRSGTNAAPNSGKIVEQSNSTPYALLTKIVLIHPQMFSSVSAWFVSNALYLLNVSITL